MKLIFLNPAHMMQTYVSWPGQPDERSVWLVYSHACAHIKTTTVDPIIRASVLHEKFVVLNKNHIQYKSSLRN